VDRDTAVALVAQRLGNRGSTFNTQIINELKSAQSIMEARPTLPWFLLSRDTTLVATGGSDNTALPSTTATSTVRGSFIQEDDFGRLTINVSGTYTKVEKGDYNSLRGTTFYTTSALPTRYSIQAGTIFWFPTPDTTYATDIFYYQQDKVLTANIENEWLKYVPDVLITRATGQMAKYLRDPAMLTAAIEEHTALVADMDAQTIARRAAALDNDTGG